MFGKKTRMAACMIVVLGSAFATDYGECRRLDEYFNMPPSRIHQQIEEYERRLKSNGGDYYANLAIAVLYTALSSPKENPETGASQKIVEYSLEFEKHEKDNPLALTYHALGCSLVSRDSKNPVTQLGQVKKAIKLFDKAVKLAANKNDEWFIRYMRGNFFVCLPDTFKKRTEAENDFAFVLRHYNADPSIEPYMCNGYFNLGEIEKSRGNIERAVSCWKRSVELNKKLSLSSKEAAEAEKRLALYAD